jgi:MFS-type transporter involved in bile tolerance (Atg22 family)
MTKTVHRIASCLLIALGVVHTALTPAFYSRLTPNAMWFAGAGLAVVFVGILNVILGRDAGRDSIVRVLCYVANLLTAAFGVLIVVVDTEPQVIFGMMLILIITTTAFLLRWVTP